MMPNEGDWLEIDESEVAQQPTYDTSYPLGLTVKWKQNRKTKLATVIWPASKWQDSHCKVRVLNSTDEYSVLISTLSPIDHLDPADIPWHSIDIYPEGLELLLSKEDLEKLWHRNQVTLSGDLKLHMY
eukprot:12600802-Ditylum_brightwellii.AAC.1